MKEKDLFISGCLPAILLEDTEYEYDDYKEKYKYIQISKGWFSSFRLFFYSDDNYEKFIDRIGGEVEELYYEDYKRDIHLSFGLPKEVVDYELDWGKYDEDKLEVDFHGIKFYCNKDRLRSSLDYMYSDYDIPFYLQSEIYIKSIKEKKTYSLEEYEHESGMYKWI